MDDLATLTKDSLKLAGFTFQLCATLTRKRTLQLIGSFHRL
jgi:hypothetical protein